MVRDPRESSVALHGLAVHSGILRASAPHRRHTDDECGATWSDPDWVKFGLGPVKDGFSTP
jgi:hypothetical protein